MDAYLVGAMGILKLRVEFYIDREAGGLVCTNAG